MYICVCICACVCVCVCVCVFMCVGECGFLNHFTDRHEHMKSQHVPGCVLIYSDSDSGAVTHEARRYSYYTRNF